MYLGIVVVSAAVIFAVQLWLCFRAKRTVVKLIPGLLTGLGALVCIAAFAAASWLERQGSGIYGAVWAAVITMYVMLILLVADGTGWVTFGLVRLIQNRKK